MNRILGSIAALGLGLAIAVHVRTFYPGPSIVTQDGSPVWLLHVGMFVVFVPMFFSIRMEFGRRPKMRELLSLFPPRARAALVAAMLYTVFNFLAFFVLSEGGTPEIRNNQFVLMNHGKLIRNLSRDEYLTFKRYEVRGFSGHGIFFYLVPTLYFLFGRPPEYDPYDASH